jgi:2-keto-4-pentenoate hydratase
MADDGRMNSELDDDAAQLTALADALREAETTRSAVPPPSSTRPGLSLDEAYHVQRVNIERRLDRGERVVGHKIGLTSLAMQRQLGVDQPDFGVITDRMVISDQGSIDVDELIAPRLEAEFAFRFGSDVPTAPSAGDLTAALDGVAVAIEVIDSRVADWKITLVDTVADNASSARIVCGEFIAASAAALAALPLTVISLVRDESDVGSGPGSAVLGDPVIALHWLASAIGAYGEHFRAGDVVLAGAVAAAVPLTPGSTWRAKADGFDSVTLHSTSIDK